MSQDPSQRLMLQCAGCEYAVNEEGRRQPWPPLLWSMQHDITDICGIRRDCWKLPLRFLNSFVLSLMFPAKVSLGECSNRLVLSVTVSSVTFASSLTKVSHESHRKPLANWKLCAGPELWWLLLQAMPFFQCQKWPYQEETRLHASPASLVTVNCKVFSFKFQQEVLRFSQRYPTSKWNA